MMNKEDRDYYQSPIPVIVLLVVVAILLMVWMGMMGVAQNVN